MASRGRPVLQGNFLIFCVFLLTFIFRMYYIYLQASLASRNPPFGNVFGVVFKPALSWFVRVLGLYKSILIGTAIPRNPLARGSFRAGRVIQKRDCITLGAVFGSRLPGRCGVVPSFYKKAFHGA
jgi:hypothetical protein